MKCFFDENGFMQDDELVESVIVEKLSSTDESKEKVQEIFYGCRDVKGSTSCETAFKVYECYYNKNKL